MSLFNTPYSLYRLSGVFNKNNSLNFFTFLFFSFVNQPFVEPRPSMLMLIPSSLSLCTHPCRASKLTPLIRVDDLKHTMLLH